MTVQSNELKGKTVLVTGASSGLGRACAIRLAACGAHVILVGRNEEVLQQVLPAEQCRTYVCDLSRPDDVAALVVQLKSEAGPIFGWVLAGGAHTLRPMVMESVASLANLWRVNVEANLQLLALAMKNRLVAKGGSIVLFSSTAARMGGAGVTSYAATKGAIESATRCLAVEVASQKIRVNSIAPGVIRTPMAEGYLNRLSEEQIASLESRHLLGFGRPEDIAGAVAFLVSADSAWMTGTVITMDGGYSVG